MGLSLFIGSTRFSLFGLGVRHGLTSTVSVLAFAMILFSFAVGNNFALMVLFNGVV